MEVMVLVMDMVDMVLVMEVMAIVDTEVTMAREMLMLSQDIMDMEVMVTVMDMVDTEVMEDMVMVDTEVIEDMDMVEDTTDKKLVHIKQLIAISHQFYFKTDSFSQLSKL